nr:unnamed protein product [Callosobruchus analis]
MAATDVHQHQLFNELNKIVKKDLIYYIINKKLPANVVSALSEEVVKFLEKGQQDDVVFHDSIATEQEILQIATRTTASQNFRCDFNPQRIFHISGDVLVSSMSEMFVPFAYSILLVQQFDVCNTDLCAIQLICGIT